MAIQTRILVKQKSNPDIAWHGTFSFEQREAMICEVAYQRYVERGCVPKHDLEDWLAAEAELEQRIPEPQELSPGMEVQQSGTHGPVKDDELKRTVKQHSHKAIPRVESVEPEKAPFKE